MVKVLSLFDGMACGYLAFDSAGLKINQYDAFEIDEYAVKLSSHNYPDIVHHGHGEKRPDLARQFLIAPL